MAKKKQPKRKPNIPFHVKDMIEAMNVVLEEYGNIVVCNLILGCFPATVNCCVYSKRDNVIYFRSFANKKEAFESLDEHEEVVHGIEPKESTDELD